MKEIIYVIALSLGSIIAIFVLTKLMGYRQMSQMSMFDYINGITICSIAAAMATSLEENFMQPLIAMIVYALAAILLSWISSKSIKARRVHRRETACTVKSWRDLRRKSEKSEDRCVGVFSTVQSEWIF